jgi:hypothetical protein
MFGPLAYHQRYEEREKGGRLGPLEYFQGYMCGQRDTREAVILGTLAHHQGDLCRSG